MLTIVFAAALLSRIAMIGSGAWIQGDSHVYLQVAQNILQHGCVSMSPPESGLCTPHWGGNQLPGYPFFIALSQWLGPDGVTSVLIAQSAVFALAAAVLSLSVVRIGLPIGAAWSVGLVAALSPSMLGWSRAVLTETLSAALALWLLAELVRAINEQRLRVLPIAVLSAVGLFLRYDFALFVVPIAFVGIALHGWRAAAARGAVILVLVATPLAAWTARSVAAGLPAVPPFGLAPDGAPMPQGALAWMGTWVTNQYQLPHSVWPLSTRSYAAIRLPADFGDNRADPDLDRDLARRLAALANDASVPIDLDRALAEAAVLQRHSAPGAMLLGLPLQRAAAMWFNPFAAMAWPPDLSGPTRAEIRQTLASDGIVAVAASYPAGLFSRATVNAWRWLMLLAGVGLVVASCFRPYRRLRLLLWCVAIFVVFRTAAFSQTLLVETRYLVPALAWLDCAVALGGFALWWYGSDRRWRRSGESDQQIG